MSAQQSTATTSVLTLPFSVRAAAAGGESVSIVDDNAGLGLHNPALLANVSPRTLNLSFMTYAAGSNLLGAQYVHAFGERHTGVAFAQLMNYGSMNETDAEGGVLGTFSPRDFMFGAGYSYLLSDRWSGGANLKFVYSSLADFRAFALGVDLGLNYFNEEKDFSFGLTARNIGVQLATFDGRPERIPFSLQSGITTALGSTPLHLSLTAVDLTRWNGRQYVTSRESGKVSWSTNLINHFVVGLDYTTPNDLLWVSLGYNFRRAYELHAAGTSGLAGLTLGAGMHLKGFGIGLSYARYHKSYSSLMFNASYSF